MNLKSSGIKEFMTFSRGERNGVLVLLILIIVLISAPFFYRSFINSPSPDNSPFNAKVDSFFSSLEMKPNDSLLVKSNVIENEELKQKKESKLFFFDPNNAKVDELVQLGLSLKQAHVIENYRAKGGLFRTPKDFAKVYVIDSFLFKRLKPWIRINTLAQSSKPKFKTDSIIVKEKVLVELNSADTLELLTINGIGRAYASRIIAYRNLLGGYATIQQLLEVYGVKTELVDKISDFITIDSTKVITININLVSYEELKKHPYISDYQAKAIIYYRSKVGALKKLEELVENKILPNEKFLKIRNYLSIY